MKKAVIILLMGIGFSIAAQAQQDSTQTNKKLTRKELREKWKNATPEQKEKLKAKYKSLTPEQKEQLKERRKNKKKTQ